MTIKYLREPSFASLPDHSGNHRDYGDGSIIESSGMALQASVLHLVHADEYSALQWLGRRANMLSSNEGHSLHPQQLCEVCRFPNRQTLAY